MTAAINVADISPANHHPAPEPFRSRLGPIDARNLGDSLALSQLGAHLVTLPPGSQSALRHWHSKSEELLYVMAGELTLIDNNGETLVGAGQCLGFHAGDGNGHHLVNRSRQAATFLVVGTRVQGDEVVYPDDDLQWHLGADGQWQPRHKDGRPY